MPCCLQGDVLRRFHSPFATRQRGSGGISAFIKGTFGKADPTLSAAAKQALLGLQCLTGLPARM